MSRKKTPSKPAGLMLIDGKHTSGGTFAAMYNSEAPFLLFEVYDDKYKELGNAVGAVTQRFEPNDKGAFVGLRYEGCSDDHYRWYIENEESVGGIPKKVVHHLCKDDPQKCKATLKNTTVLHCRRWSPVPWEVANAALQEWGYPGLVKEPISPPRTGDGSGDGLGLRTLPPRKDQRPPLQRKKAGVEAPDEEDDEDFEEEGEEEREPPKRKAAKTRASALKNPPAAKGTALDAMLEGEPATKRDKNLEDKLDGLREKLRVRAGASVGSTSKPGGILAKRAVAAASKAKKKKRRSSDVVGELKKALKKKRKKETDESEDDSDESSEGDKDDEDEREASGGWQQKRKRYKKIAEKEPGRLMMEALEAMQEQLGAHYGDDYSAGDRLQPMVTRYFLSVVIPSIGSQRIPKHYMRELRTIAMSADMLLRGRSDSAGDCLLQRFKSICIQIRDGSDRVGPQLELLPEDVFGTGATTEDSTFAREIAYKEAVSQSLLGKSLKGAG